MGLAASLKAGIAALPADIAAVIVCLGDMPLVGPELIDRLLAAYAPAEERGIVVPTWRGRRGNPVLWDRRYFADILGLAGDTGARGLMQRHADQVAEIDAGTDAVVRDFDSPETLNTLRDPTG
jgi:molybdenum cofactor cytidylyltransferase